MTYDEQFNVKIDSLSVFMKKIELADKAKHIGPALYRDIITNMEEAFSLDFNEIILDFELYQKLSPKM